MEPILESELEKRVQKILREASEYGWKNPGTSLVARFSKESAHSFYIRWQLNTETMRFRFDGARVMHVSMDTVSKLSLSDVSVYLKDPSVIFKEKPE